VGPDALRADLIEQLVERGDELVDSLPFERCDDVVIDARGVKLG
jgi:hypothetical protein